MIYASGVSKLCSELYCYGLASLTSGVSEIQEQKLVQFS